MAPTNPAVLLPAHAPLRARIILVCWYVGTRQVKSLSGR
jgi:hypothetical protein